MISVGAAGNVVEDGACYVESNKQIRALAYTTSDCNTHIETWSLAHIVLLEPCTKFHIFEHSNKLRKGLDCIFGTALLNFFETGQYDFYYVQ